MLAKYFSIIRNYVLSVCSQIKYNFNHQHTLLDAFRTNSHNIIGRNPSMVIPSLANQDLTPRLRPRQKGAVPSPNSLCTDSAGLRECRSVELNSKSFLKQEKRF